MVKTFYYLLCIVKLPVLGFQHQNTFRKLKLRLLVLKLPSEITNTFQYCPFSNIKMCLVYPEVWGKQSFWFWIRDTQTDLQKLLLYFICTSKPDVPLAHSTKVDSVSYSSLSPYSPPNLVQRKGEILKAKFWPFNLHVQTPKSLKFLLSTQLLPEEKCSSWGKEGGDKRENQNKVILAFTRPTNSHFIIIALKWGGNSGFQP